MDEAKFKAGLEHLRQSWGPFSPASLIVSELIEAVEAQPAHQHQWLRLSVAWWECQTCSALKVRNRVYMPVCKSEGLGRGWD